MGFGVFSTSFDTFFAGDNAAITYSIYHISNNGNDKFKINPVTGEIETVDKMSTGEQYSLTVQATDKGGLYSQAIVEVTVSPGPNTRPPIFEEEEYDIEVSEGVTINSTIATIVVSLKDCFLKRKLTHCISGSRSRRRSSNIFYSFRQ